MYNLSGNFFCCVIWQMFRRKNSKQLFDVDRLLDLGNETVFLFPAPHYSEFNGNTTVV